MNERPIPSAALSDENSVEMLRVWIADRKLHCSIKVGMYHETTRIPEEDAWGTILADTARHLGEALQLAYGMNAAAAIQKIRDSFNAELDKPTSPTEGDFI